MKQSVTLSVLTILATGSQAFGQPVRKGAAPRAAVERANTAAAQVAVAQADLYGSMLVSYRLDPHSRAGALLTLATRYERRLVQVDARDYRVRVLRKEAVKDALPGGILICRSYAPIDAIIKVARVRHPGKPIEIFPPHLPSAPWRAKILTQNYKVNFDKRGRAAFESVRSRG